MAWSNDHLSAMSLVWKAKIALPWLCAYYAFGVYMYCSFISYCHSNQHKSDN